MMRAGTSLAALLLAAHGAIASSPEIYDVGRFGSVTVYRPSAPPRDVVLFLSGDGGWNLGVISMAQRLTEQGALVAGIDIRHYLAQLESSTDACVSPAADLSMLNDFLKSKLGSERTITPTLLGYSSGATLVYATLAQAAPGTFKGALSLGFCPDLDLKKPLCRGSGIEATPRQDAKGHLKGVDFLPAKQLAGSWISLQGQTDQVCPAPATQAFIAKVAQGSVVLLPKVGHGYSVERNWLPQYLKAYAQITDAKAQ